MCGERERKLEREREREKEGRNEGMKEGTLFHKGNGLDSGFVYIQPSPMRD